MQPKKKKKDEISEIYKSLGTWLVQYLVVVISWYFVLFVHHPSERWGSSAVFQTAKGGGSKSDSQLCFVYIFVMEHIVSTSFVHSFICSTNIYGARLVLQRTMTWADPRQTMAGNKDRIWAPLCFSGPSWGCPASHIWREQRGIYKSIRSIPRTIMDRLGYPRS